MTTASPHAHHAHVSRGNVRNAAMTSGIVLLVIGVLGFIPGIDYANPDLSHFNSRHFWETGVISLNPGAGWLARWVDRNGGPDNPFQGMSMDAGLSPLLAPLAPRDLLGEPSS